MAGSLPDKVRRWFGQGMPVPDVKPRTDHYLILPAVDFIGAKLREGRIEVKRREFDLGLALLGSRVTGRLALWRKWSFTVAGNGCQRAPDGHWISVEKTRLLRNYIVENPGLTALDQTRSFSDLGCTVELTEIKVRDVEWWSFGFEAFGPDENRLRDALELVATTCFDLDHPPLQAADSFDYPEWLARLGGVS